MLQNLVADPETAEVHCLCLRSRPLRVKDAKIREYKGDLVKPLLGLATNDFTRFCQTTDLIIYVWADVAHLKSYEQMRTANVVSTQTLYTSSRRHRWLCSKGILSTWLRCRRPPSGRQPMPSR